MSLRAGLAAALCTAVLLAALAGPARAADECNGLRVCLPVAGPWVAVPAGGVDYELACPLPGYVVGGTDARVPTADVDVSFRGESGSPVGPGVTTRRSVVFHAARTRVGAGPTSFRPFIGCIPARGGGGRALTVVAGSAAVIKPTQPLLSVVLNAPIRRPSVTLRLACPGSTRLVASMHAVAFRQALPPSAAALAAVRVRRTLAEGIVVARVTAVPAAAGRAEVQLRVVCARAR